RPTPAARRCRAARAPPSAEGSRGRTGGRGRDRGFWVRPRAHPIRARTVRAAAALLSDRGSSWKNVESYHQRHSPRKPETLGGAAAADADLKIAAAAKQSGERSGLRVRICRDESADLMPRGGDPDRPADRHALEATAIDVGHEVPESIDAQHDTRELAALDARLRHVEPLPARDRPAERTQAPPVRE